MMEELPRKPETDIRLECMRMALEHVRSIYIQDPAARAKTISEVVEIAKTFYNFITSA